MRRVWDQLHEQHVRFWPRALDDGVRGWEVYLHFSNMWTKEHWRLVPGAGLDGMEHHVPYLFMPWRTRRVS